MTTPASLRNRPLDRASVEAGFTLIELLVVIVLVGIIATFAAPQMGSLFKTSLNATAREVGTRFKEAYTAALVNSKVYRMAFDLDKDEYWIEVGPENALLDTTESREREARRKRFARPDESPPPSSFSIAKRITSKKLSLPRGIRYTDIVTGLGKEPVTEGTAYAHVFPNGFTEKTLIHVKDLEDHELTLVLEPLLGKTQMLNGYVSEKELENANKK